MPENSNFKFAIIKNRNGKLLAQGYKSLIVAVFPYFYPEKTELFSKYASIYDYHTVIKEEFEEFLSSLSYEYKIFADISPFNEKKLAEDLGLGEIGRHGILITKEFSSFVFIGEAAIRAELPELIYPKEKICTGCNKCIKACPTGALDGGFNKEKCLSYITQKKKLSPDQELLLKKTKCIWGCDICQLACPITKKARITNISKFKKPILDLTSYMLMEMDDAGFRERYQEFAFAYKGVELLQRNVKAVGLNINAQKKPPGHNA